MSETKTTYPMEIQIYEKRIGLLKWNFESLNAALDESLAKYRGVVYTDDQINLAKKDRALLNSFRKSINDRKIQLKKEFCEPYDEFAEQVKVLTQKVDSAAAEIDAQIKAFEEKEKAEKKKRIEEYWFDIKPDKNLVDLEQVWDQKWLNKSVKDSEWQKALDQRAAKIHDDLHAIAVSTIGDTAKMDFCIGEYIKTLDLGAAYVAWENKLQQEARQAELSAKLRAEQERREQEHAELEMARKQAENAPVEPQPAEAKTAVTIYARDMHIEGTYEQLMALTIFMKEHGIKFITDKTTKRQWEEYR